MTTLAPLTRTKTISLSSVPRREAQALRALDVTLGVVMLLAMLPILLIAALAIRLTSPGPAIFRQRRLGRDGEPFTVLKFRTMRTGAEQRRHRDYVRQLIRSSEASSTDRDQLFKLVVDDRVTRVGRLLRKTSLDEVPQIWNVLRGDMSLVGPRPVIPYEAEIYPDWYWERFEVKPGLTGLWQVSGRNELTYQEMVQLDIEYVRRRSLRLYLRVLLRTVPTVLFRRGVA